MSAAEQAETVALGPASVRPRVGRAVGAVAVAAATGLAIIGGADPDPPRSAALAGWLVGTALVVLVGAVIARLVAAVGAAVVLLGVAYGVAHVHAADAVPGSAMLVGPALLAVAELASWSIDLSPAAADETGALRARAGWLGAVVVGTGGVGLLLAGLAQVRLTGEAPLDGLAVMAAVGLVSLVVALARPVR